MGTRAGRSEGGGGTGRAGWCACDAWSRAGGRRLDARARSPARRGDASATGGVGGGAVAAAGELRHTVRRPALVALLPCSFWLAWHVEHNGRKPRRFIVVSEASVATWNLPWVHGVFFPVPILGTCTFSARLPV